MLRRSAVAGAVVAAAALVGPASAHKDPVTGEQLKAYQAAFMEEVRKGDLLFHGDGATAQEMGVTLSTTGWACAMCHPMASDTHPHTFPKFQVQIGGFATLRDMINWCIEKPNQGEKIDPESEAMKALEAYITWSNTGSVLVPGKY
jgi:thiosulfate dehydrogenase